VGFASAAVAGTRESGARPVLLSMRASIAASHCGCRSPLYRRIATGRQMGAQGVQRMCGACTCVHDHLVTADSAHGVEIACAHDSASVGDRSAVRVASDKRTTLSQASGELLDDTSERWVCGTKRFDRAARLSHSFGLRVFASVSPCQKHQRNLLT